MISASFFSAAFMFCYHNPRAAINHILLIFMIVQAPAMIVPFCLALPYGLWLFLGGLFLTGLFLI